MPRQTAKNINKNNNENIDVPRRGVGKSIAIDDESERGFAISLFLRSPKDVVAAALAFAAVTAIIANALFLQAGHHPSPMFGSVVPFPAQASAQDVAVANPLPRPRPAEAISKSADAAADDVKPVAARVEPKVDPKGGDPLTNLVKATSVSPVTSTNIPGYSVPRPPAPIPVSARSDTSMNQGMRRVAAVQRALTEYGDGQLKPTGILGSDTQVAIQKFERERKLPVTGQVSERLVRELAAVIGHPLD